MESVGASNERAQAAAAAAFSRAVANLSEMAEEGRELSLDEGTMADEYRQVGRVWRCSMNFAARAKMP